ncbi:long-chain fatty acid--CoA ligase [Caldimonas brevitalea]|uniref:Long-chain-fatty-acid--CoA ligase n=2 Tax=Caldimonas brevitalea TaxID=413882 RepID=A0A0G3BLM8_9BURK|nr:AMP-binding protein [Caldimonas brevitalea]AKJ27465.1 long-chain fatty acid--CoA ligase [Caldimonas brevitalea]
MGVPIPETERVWLKSYRPDVPFEVDPDRYQSIGDFFDENVRRYSERAAFVSLGSEMSYRRCGQLAEAFAAWLHRQGVRKGDRVALMMPNCLQYPVCLFGTLLAGAVVVNVNPLYTAHELAHQLQDSGAETIVVLDMFSNTLAEALPGTAVKRVLVTGIGDLLAPGLNLKGRVVNLVMRRKTDGAAGPARPIAGALPLRRALAEGGRLPRPSVTVEPTDLAFLQYTGGTTGVAKGAMLTHRNIVANLLQSLAWRGKLDDPNRVETNLSLLPLYHIFSLTVNCLIFMGLGGRNVLIANPRDVKRVMQVIRRENFTGIAGVSTLFNSFLEDETFCQRDFSQLRLTISGGMATPQAIADRWQQLTGKCIIEGYGLTECSPIVTINPIDFDHPEHMRFTGTIGLPVPSTEVRFRSDDGSWAPLGEPGELCVRGPQVMAGYWGRPEETAKVIDAEGWLSTGDIGVMDEHGYVRLIDRKKDMILVSGFNVYPNEVEDAVMGHPGVREVAALGVPDPVAGERVKIVVVRKNPKLTEAELLAHCRERLVGYKMPRVVEFRETELPKSNVGKILRRELR